MRQVFGRSFSRFRKSVSLVRCALPAAPTAPACPSRDLECSAGEVLVTASRPANIGAALVNANPLLPAPIFRTVTLAGDPSLQDTANLSQLTTILLRHLGHLPFVCRLPPSFLPRPLSDFPHEAARACPFPSPMRI
jgi:hypothetical protein